MSGCKKEACSNVSICKRSKHIEDEGVDRLSSLPDNLLVSILNLLPIRSAAATSVLSRRWRHLWTHITHITLPPKSRISPGDKVDVHRTICIIDHIFSQLNSPKIHHFHLSLCSHLYHKINCKLVDRSVFVSVIHHICARNPEVIELTFPPSGLNNILDLPATVFETQSLVCLHLYGFFQVPDHPKLLIDLPNLKSLHLSVDDSNRSLIATLFKCCPLLEHLHLSMWSQEEMEPCFVDIKAPNLKRLVIDIQQDYHSASLCNHKFVIDAPMLEYCDMLGHFVFYDFVKSPRNLVEVRIQLRNSTYSDNYRTKILQLFTGICWVESLILTHLDCPLLCLLSELDCIGTSTFHDLISLEIERNYHDQLDWEQFPCFPRCLLTNLMQLKIKDLMGTNLEIKMLQHILSNAPVLEYLYVSVCSYYENRDSHQNVDQLRKEYNFCRKLFGFPKISESCDIQFSGVAIKTSNKYFINGVLNCNINNYESSDSE